MSESNLMANSIPLGRAYEILEDGREFGGYTIVRCLAYDMLGTLYLATNQQTGQNESLFVFPSLVGQDREFPERFATHAKKLCVLKHPNLLTFTQPLIIHNSYCLVGEAFECLNIPDHLMLLTGSQLSTSDNKQAANLPPQQVTPIIEQVLAGLAYAHDCKVMHLNLNPTKILRGVRGEVKVYGFHFLAILGQELFEMLVSAGIPPLKLDPNRSFLGTTDILSPEARLRTTLEYRSDIYAVGVDTHWLLTGRKPTSPYQPPSQIVTGIEPGWDAFTQHCLQRKLDDRYTTALTALTDLRNIAQLTPLIQRQPLELLLAPEAPAPAPEKKKASKLPVPKKVKPPKGVRHARKPLTLAQRLLFIGLPSLLAVALAAFIYVKIETSEDAEAGVPVRAQPGHNVRLMLNITPHIAVVTIDKTVFNVSDGKLPVSMPKGTYSVTINAPPKYAKSIFNYTTQNEQDTMFVNLVPAWAVVDIDTAPGATVEALPAKGTPLQLGVADANGKLHITKNLGDDTYTFTASKTDYSTARLADQKIELTKTYHLDLAITAVPATVTLKTDPPGVTVRMGTRVLGVTPFTTTEIPVDSDVHLILEKQGYQSVPRRLRVSPNVTIEDNLGNLAARMGELNLDFKLSGHAPTAEEARDAKITINNQNYPATTKHIAEMLEGTYTVSFEHPDYDTTQVPVTIVEGKIASATANLPPKPAHLAIHATPALPVVVYLNNTPITAGANGQYILPPGQKVKVRIQAQNYADAEKDFTLGPNKSATWDVALSLLTPPVLGQDYTVPYLNLALKWIKPGQYTMGSPSTEFNRVGQSEGPPTTVTIPSGFWAGAYEVTQDQYQAIMGENPSTYGKNTPDQGHHPVEMISWLKAREFTQKLTERERTAKRLPEGYEYRLPTRAEWEYLARAGTTTPFSFGDSADPSKGNFKGAYPVQSGISIASQNNITGTKAVGSYAPNAWGLYDVHGNVSEWVLDAYKSRLPGDAITAPALTAGDANARREYRGGGWSDYASDCRAAWRDLSVLPDTVSSAIGMRVVLAPIITAKP